MTSVPVPIRKQVYNLESYPKVIDTNFTEFAPPPPAVEEAISVERFFELYQELFFEIPVNGATNSHEYLVKTSGEYVGASYVSVNEQALLEEINTLRQQLLTANQTLIDLSKLT